MGDSPQLSSDRVHPHGVTACTTRTTSDCLLRAHSLSVTDAHPAHDGARPTHNFLFGQTTILYIHRVRVRFSTLASYVDRAVDPQGKAGRTSLVSLRSGGQSQRYLWPQSTSGHVLSSCTGRTGCASLAADRILDLLEQSSVVVTWWLQAIPQERKVVSPEKSDPSRNNVWCRL